MPKSKEFVSSSDSESSGEEPKPKKKKVEKKEESPKKSADKSSHKPRVGQNGEHMFEISGNKYATVSTFKGKVYVGVREYYEKDGKILPTKKGVSLNQDQWESFKKLISSIDQSLTEVS